jgi:hypothetical protein
VTFIKVMLEIGSSGTVLGPNGEFVPYNNSIATEIVDDMHGEFDMDGLCGTLTFTLPYYINYPDSDERQNPVSENGLDTNRLKKFDTVKLYFYEAESDPGEITQGTKTFRVFYADGTFQDITENAYFAGGNEMALIFDGFIDKITLERMKGSMPYTITALGTLGMANYRNLEYAHKEGTAYELFQTLLQIAGLQIGQFNVNPVMRDLIPAWKLRFIDLDAKNRVLITDGGSDLKGVLEKFRKKYALIVHQSGDGYMNVMTPFYLLSAQSDGTLSVNAWRFDTNDGTAVIVQYGDLTAQYNAVVVLGAYPSFGVAVDPIAVQNNGGHINYTILENRKAKGDEECQKIARSEYLNIAKDYAITIKTKFKPEFMIGQPFTLNDHDRFTGNEVFLIKRYTWDISKGDVSASVVGITQGAVFVPENLKLSDTGILDVDTLQIRDKELDIRQWRSL